MRSHHDILAIDSSRRPVATGPISAFAENQQPSQEAARLEQRLRAPDPGEEESDDYEGFFHGSNQRKETMNAPLRRFRTRAQRDLYLARGWIESPGEHVSVAILVMAGRNRANL